MATEIPTLKATNREQLGSRYAKRLRTAGKLPAVLYGHGTAPMSLTLDAKETIHSLKHGAHVVKLAIEGGATDIRATHWKSLSGSYGSFLYRLTFAAWVLLVASIRV